MNKTNEEYLFAERSDIGKIRKINEDSYGNIKVKNGHYFFVCDGMGGHEGGEIASSIAVNAIKNFITNNQDLSKSFPDFIISILNYANNEIFASKAEHNNLKEMGTTCVLLYLESNKAFIGNVGDSRIYHIHDNKIIQLTKDQSFVQELVNQNLITPEEAENHPRRNEILQALGLTKKIIPDTSVSPIELSNGDFLLLCSDGLTNFVSDGLMLSLIKPGEPGYSCSELINAANNAGGKDNITVQLIEMN